MHDFSVWLRTGSYRFQSDTGKSFTLDMEQNLYPPEPSYAHGATRVLTDPPGVTGGLDFVAAC